MRAGEHGGHLNFPAAVRPRAALGQHDDLPTRLVLLHAAMRLSDFVKVEGPADLDA